MLATTLSLALLMQAPGPSDSWVHAGGRAAPPNTFAVEGALELSRGEAEASATDLARDAHRERLRGHGRDLAQRLAPFWLPQLLVRGEVEAWALREERATPIRVVSRETSVRQYSYGKAYQTTLHVADDARGGRSAEAWLERRLEHAARLLLAKCGGIAVFWGLLAFLSSWFDRLTRGYMTWRLRLIAFGLGGIVPALVLLA